MTFPIAPTPSAELLAHAWRALLFRGVTALLFGLALIVWPGLTITALVMLFGAFALAEGGITLGSAISNHARGWASALAGVTGLLVGGIALLAPVASAYALATLFAAWAIVTGAFELTVPFRLPPGVDGSWALTLSGVVSVLLGILIAVAPTPGLLALAWFIGGLALAAGVFDLALVSRLYKHQHGWRPPSPDADHDAAEQGAAERDLTGAAR